jgi:class 3 adenylate cyclase
MRCPNCDSENYEPTRFCIECGAAFKRSCPKCGSGNLPQAKFCGDCGVTLAADGVQSLTIPRAPVASTGLADAQADISAAAQDERKTVTALFADIKGSTELMEDLDPEEARAIIAPALKIMVEAVRRYEGYVVQSTGDGIFALFGAPVAHEDHPQRALYAALQMQQELRRPEHARRANGRRWKRASE